MHLLISIYLLLPFSPNPNLRKSAELEIKSLESSSGMLSSVFQLSTSSQFDLALRQASSIYLKNRIYTSWDPPTSKENRFFDSSNLVPIPDQDKQNVRSAIINSLIDSPKQISVHLSSAFGSIVRYDYPKVWGNDLIQQVGTLLSDTTNGQEGDRRREAGMRATLELVRSFR